MSTAILTAAITAIVAVFGTLVAYSNRNKDSIDKRLNMALEANQQLIDDYRAENEKLLARVDRMEVHLAETDRELRRVRDALSIQGEELRTVRHQNTEWRSWGIKVAAWCAMATNIVTALGGTIVEPPTPPSRYSADV